MNHKGFASTVIILAIIVAGAMGAGGWYVYNSSRSLPLKTTPNPDTKVGTNPVEPATPKDIESSCPANSILIVIFKKEVSKERTLEIIKLEEATINRTYESFNGYALNVARGKENMASSDFRKYPEVDSSEINGCTSTTNTPGTSN